MRIIDTDNFGGDYPDEKFHLVTLPQEVAQQICDLVNNSMGASAPRFFKVVPNDYKLQPGFEP